MPRARPSASPTTRGSYACERRALYSSSFVRLTVRTFARPEPVEGRAVWLVVRQGVLSEARLLRQACPEQAAHPSTGSGGAAGRRAHHERMSGDLARIRPVPIN